MPRTAVLNVVGLTRRHIGPNTPRIQSFVTENACSPVRPALPAVTCAAQSNYLTGKPPSEHGIVANGWYNRAYAEIQFWKQPDALVQQRKIWETLREADPDFTCAKLFWWYNMYSSVDYSITPRPMYPADGRKVFDIYTHPMDLREEIKADLGDFPFFTFWGPRAGLPSSEWIAQSAQWIEERHQPSLSLVYLPHLDYNLQRLGPSHPDIAQDLQAIDQVVGRLIDFFESRSVQVALLSEYGITDVDQPIHVNRALRQKGWITIKDELGLEMLDPGASKAFAVADHQVAHVYLNEPALEAQVRDTLSALPGVAQVLDREQQRAAGLAHARSGDLVAVSQQNAWFTYYYWLDDAVAPDFARCVDIHRKAGYDPVELFIDPKIKFPRAKIAQFLLKKKLGFRALLDAIPLDASLVKGSHGCLPQSESDWPVFISSQPQSGPLDSTQVHDRLLALCQG